MRCRLEHSLPILHGAEYAELGQGIGKICERSYGARARSTAKWVDGIAANEFVFLEAVMAWCKRLASNSPNVVIANYCTSYVGGRRWSDGVVLSWSRALIESCSRVCRVTRCVLTAVFQVAGWHCSCRNAGDDR